MSPRLGPQTWSPDLVPRLGTPSDSPDPPLRSTPRQQEWLQCESPGESEKGLNPDLAGCLIKNNKVVMVECISRSSFKNRKFQART